jgi:N-acetyl-1-D-myo-inositol-2-amino-2-deoxy-alpha-D-glucopyranoside deacetylase
MPDPERVLFVHAHPDDETIDTGGTIATLIDRGAWVTVLTCTRGERGEVIASNVRPADLKGALESTVKMAALRTAELTKAMAILRVTDHRYLGDESAHSTGRPTRTYRDSGMTWGSGGAQSTGEADANTLEDADLDDVAADIASVILDMRPGAIVSYNAGGGYGHPDHVRVHDAATRAAAVCGIPYYAIDAQGDLRIDISDVLDRKRAALGAYRSQVTLEGDTMVYPGGQRLPLVSVERYRLAAENNDAPIPFSEQHPGARFVAAVLGGIVGLALGGVFTVYNQFTARIAGQDIWVGAIAAVIVVAAALAGFRLAFGTRIVPAFTAAGVIVVVVVFSLPTDGATRLILQTGPGLLWQIAPFVIAVVVLVWPQGRRRGPGKIAG